MTFGMKPGDKWFVVDVQKLCIDSGHPNIVSATARSTALGKETLPGAVKVMSKPRVGGLVLDPHDPASWRPKRNNPNTMREFPENGRRVRAHPVSAHEPNVGNVVWAAKDEIMLDDNGYEFAVDGLGRGIDWEYEERKNPRFGNPSPMPGDFVQAVGGDSTNRVYEVVSVSPKGVMLRNVINDDIVKCTLEEFERKYRRENPTNVVRSPRDKRLWEEAKASAEQQGRGRDWRYVMGIFQHMKHRTGSGPYKNPSELLVVNPAEGLDSRRAEKTFRMWHQKEPSRVDVKSAGTDWDDEMVCIGNAFDIVYRSGKWEAGKKTNDYVHTFDSKPKVWMLAKFFNEDMGACKTVAQLCHACCNADGQLACADLARPLSFGIDDGEGGESSLKISSGARVYGGVDHKTVIIYDPKWKIIVVKGGKMHFDERGIIK